MCGERMVGVRAGWLWSSLLYSTRVLLVVGSILVLLLWISFSKLERAPSHLRMQGGYAFWDRQVETSNVRGILLLLHGCSHSALDFWVPSSSCTNCVGLPEELRLVEIAKKNGLVPVAVSSHGRCWELSAGEIHGSPDWERVKNVLEHVKTVEGLSAARVYAFGASSGGAFASYLPRVLKLSGLIVQIMAASQKALDYSLTIDGYPPTAFIHMPRDTRTKKRVESNIETLKMQKVPAVEFSVSTSPITSTFFFDRSGGRIPVEESERIFTALQWGHFLTNTSHLELDPRRSNWREVLHQSEPVIAKKDGLEADKSGISELLNVAFATHELTSEHFQDALDFLFEQK